MTSSNHESVVLDVEESCFDSEVVAASAVESSVAVGCRGEVVDVAPQPIDMQTATQAVTHRAHMRGDATDNSHSSRVKSKLLSPDFTSRDRPLVVSLRYFGGIVDGFISGGGWPGMGGFTMRGPAK